MKRWKSLADDGDYWNAPGWRNYRPPSATLVGFGAVNVYHHSLSAVNCVSGAILRAPHQHVPVRTSQMTCSADSGRHRYRKGQFGVCISWQWRHWTDHKVTPPYWRYSIYDANKSELNAEVRFYADHVFRLVYNTQNSRDWLEDSMFDVKAKAMQRIISPTIAQFCTSRLGAT